MAQEYSSQDSISYELALKLRDLEEIQKLSKERLLLIGENLVEWQEKTNNELTELKKAIQTLQTDLSRVKSITQSLSEEISKSARKEELEILKRQYKMFEPLDIVRMEDIEKILDKKQKHESKSEEKPTFWTGKL